MIEKNSYDYIADAVRTYWKNTFPRDVVAFFNKNIVMRMNGNTMKKLFFAKVILIMKP